MPLFDKLLIYRLIDRLKNTKIDKIVIATSSNKDDLAIKVITDQLNFKFFKVIYLVLENYILKLKKLNANYILRNPVDKLTQNHNEIDK